MTGGREYIDHNANSTPALVLHTDFPIGAWASVDEHLTRLFDPRVGPQDRTWLEAKTGWTGVLFRYAGCFDAATTLTDVFASPGDDMPKPGRRLRQERALFEFFVGGMSALDAAAYTAYALAALVEPGAFPFVLDTDRRRVGVGSTTDRFRRVFPDDDVTTGLQQTASSDEFKRWATWRNRLVHREVPSRTIDTKPWPVDFARVADDQLRPETFDQYRAWLASALTSLAQGTATFAETHL